MSDKILIVDDDVEFRSELKEFLEGYEVVEAQNGPEALEKLKSANEIGLVILDVKMPGLSGTKVLREMKKLDSKLHIILVTGHGSKDVVIDALKGHADDFIEKPLDLDKVKAIVEQFANKIDYEIDATGMESDDKIHKIKRFIERNCLRKTSLTDAASALCLSPKYISRIFKQQAGVSFSYYKITVKIKKAKEMLQESSYNINQIAYKLGYENSESFIRQFKRITKYTPTKYRRKMHRKSVHK
jgi:two-component system, response regulator YesN